MDINGNVNAYVTNTSVDRSDVITGSVHHANGDGSTRNSIGTGLLPAWIGFTGKTRQNDLDVEFTISMQPGASNNTVHGDGSVGGENATFLNRQTYLSFGDKSWGTIKIGKDLGIYASDAILNDMTLLGVGGFHSAGNGLSGSAINTTTGGIGAGYQYAAWRGQLAYTSPNWNGFQFTAGIMNPNQVGPGVQNDVPQSQFGFEGKASYSWAGDVSGKVWVSGASYELKQSAGLDSERISAYDIGANVNVAGFGLTGYYYNGNGNGSATLGLVGLDANNNKRDGDGGYLQGTYTIPGVGTKIGLAYGVSNLDTATAAERNSDLLDKTRRYTVGAYHPLTKHLNLVAEYNDYKVEAHGAERTDFNSISAGAILFF